jgi:flavorubredoxin
MPASTSLPREFAPGVWWLGGCLGDGGFFEEPVHFHVSAYVVKGSERAAIFDTSMPAFWPQLERDLDQILGERPLDYVVPSHPESAHGGNVGSLLDKYPAAVAAGDMRDYHLYYPEHADRLRQVDPGVELDLGGGYGLVLLDAVIEDLPNSIWAYERREQVLFTADALAYGHLAEATERFGEPVHRAGECALMSSEMEPPALAPTVAITQGGLFWSRHVDIAPYLKQLDELMEQYPTRLIAPAHGNVVDDLEVVIPLVREAHRIAFEQGAV